MSKRGRQQEPVVDAMMVFALLLERTHGAKPKPARRAAILAFFTWVDDPKPRDKIYVYEERVAKAVQRFKRQRRGLHPVLLRALGLIETSTGKPLFGTPLEMAEGVAKFLPRL